ncbi:hypothetical protein TWF481_008243 [Arthrobotrys musiformis]|uniref:SP-RING-type domain-containing protein n=1 Tax=Arthrobotrys musiformis TaxID=47236 RepID=A0AAV9W6Q0_9PEZI
MPPRRHQSGPRRVKPSYPEHKPCVLPIDQAASGELRAIHAKYPPQNLTRWIQDATELLRESSARFAENRREKLFDQDKPRDEVVEQKVAELGVRVEKGIRGLVDADEEVKLMKMVLQGISEAERGRGEGDGVQPVEEFERQMKKGEKAYRRRDLKDRYGNSAEYIELRSLVYGVAKPTAPQPQRKDWFRTPMFVCDGEAQISDEDPLSESEGEEGQPRDPDVEMADSDDDSDDGIQEVAVKRNLKCPLTMQYFKEPVKAGCGHVFEKEALLEVLKGYKQQKKDAICPNPGCGKLVNVKELRPDALTKRLVEAKIKEKELAEQRAVVAGAGNDDDDDDDEEVVVSRSKTKNPSSRPLAIKEEEIPYGDEERVPDSHDEGGEEDEDEDEDDEDRVSDSHGEAEDDDEEEEEEEDMEDD